MRKKEFLAFLLTLAFTPRLLAATKNIAPIGPHEPVLIFEKNENPQNILVLYTKLDSNCRPEQKDGRPFVDYYWLMNGKDYKPVNSIIKDRINQHVKISTNDEKEILLHLNDLEQLKTGLKDPTVEIQGRREGSKCSARATIQLAAGESPLRLEKIRTESEKTVLPPFRKVLSISLTGEDQKTHHLVTRTFSAR